MITKNLNPTYETREALLSSRAADRLQAVSIERIKDELDKMLAHNTLASLKLLAGLPELVGVMTAIVMEHDEAQRMCKMISLYQEVYEPIKKPATEE